MLTYSSLCSYYKFYLPFCLEIYIYVKKEIKIINFKARNISDVNIFVGLDFCCFKYERTDNSKDS